MRIRLTATGLIFIVGVAAPLYADPITLQFSGPVIQRTGTPPEAIGDFAAGSLSFNSGTLSIVEDTLQSSANRNEKTMSREARRSSPLCAVE
jgi:hypothetical protein